MDYLVDGGPMGVGFPKSLKPLKRGWEDCHHLVPHVWNDSPRNDWKDGFVFVPRNQRAH